QLGQPVAARSTGHKPCSLPGTSTREESTPMKRNYESARVLVRATGPLASHLDPFIASLIEQQYRASVIYIKARHGLALDRWLAKRRVALARSADRAVSGPLSTNTDYVPLAWRSRLWQAVLLQVGT